MYRVYSKDRITIINHYCNTEELAGVIKNYIEPKHNCTITIEKCKNDLVYFDVPGMRFMSTDLYNVAVGKVETRIDDVKVLVAVFAVEPDFSRGFFRFGSFAGNICLSQDEYNETKKFIEENSDLIEKWQSEAEETKKRKSRDYPRRKTKTPKETWDYSK